jgi:hypothetical protein
VVAIGGLLAIAACAHHEVVQECEGTLVPINLPAKSAAVTPPAQGRPAAAHPE